MTIDLQEATRRDDVYRDLNEIVDKITVLPVFPSLVWVWSFDVLRSIYENNRFEDLFDKFWEDADGIGISMDLGDEIIDETIRDWMRDNDFLVALDNDGWLDEEEEEDATD